MKVKELIDLINSSENCYSIWNAEDLFGSGVYRVFANFRVYEYKKFITATYIYKCEDGYVGITGPSLLKSKDITWSDCDYPCFAEEYEAYNTISYRPIER